jgi:hypothetical protein
MGIVVIETLCIPFRPISAAMCHGHFANAAKRAARNKSVTTMETTQPQNARDHQAHARKAAKSDG